MEVNSRLILLARSLENDQPLQAIRCYEGVLQSAAGGTLSPVAQVEARLGVARLLLLHTHNVYSAKTHLEHAQRLCQAKKSPVPTALKLRVYNEIASCLKVLASGPLMRQVLGKALEVVSSELSAADESSDALPLTPAEYRFHFGARAAEGYLVDGDLAGAEVALQRALKDLSDYSPEDHAVTFVSPIALVGLLQLAQVQLQQCKLQSAAESLQLATAAAAGLAPEDHAAADTWLPTWRLHLAVLKAAHFLAAGMPEPAADVLPGVPAPGSHAERHLDVLKRRLAEFEASTSGGGAAPPTQPWTWLEPTALRSLSLLTQSSLLRSLNRATDALAAARRGLEGTTVELVRLGVLHADSHPDHTQVRADESAMSPEAVLHCTPVLRIHAMLLESRALTLLLSCALADALTTVADLLALLDRFPGLLAPSLAPSAHLLVGIYLQSAGDVAQALKHFARARALRPSLESLARSLACLALLSQDAQAAEGPGGDASRAALAALGPVHTSCEEDGPGGESASEHVRAVGLLAGGLLSKALGSDADAKRRLSRALKLAHKQLGNHQLLSTTLSVYALLTHSLGDHSGGLQMLNSAFAIGRGPKDFPAQVTCLRGLVEVSRADLALKEAAGASDSGAEKKGLETSASLLEQRSEETRRQMVFARSRQQDHQSVQRWNME